MSQPTASRQMNDPKKANEPRKSILVIPSRVISRPDEVEGGEEIEIAAQISVPEEGGWGWVVVAASFWNIFIVDGIAFTFGSLRVDMAKDFGIEDSLIALANSITTALYFSLGPLCSAFINRFGFRFSAMAGAVIASFSLLCSYFTTNYTSFCVFYGGFAGIGFCLVNLSAGLIVGFYFEKLRSLALTLSAAGSSVGIMLLYPFNAYLVSLAGWRATTLLHSGMFGTAYFSAMTFRPLLSLTVVTTTDDPTRTVTFLPNLNDPVAGSRTKTDRLVPTVTERLFSAVSNANFPTAALVVEDGMTTSSSQPGTSKQPVSKLTLKANTPQGGMSRRQIKQAQSIISKTSVRDKTSKNVEVTVHVEEPKKRSCWGRICHWERHVPESRPMYRDDAFYEGNVEKLEVYQKSMLDTTVASKTGLEYQMAVSRAVTAGDLKENRGIFTTAARRVLATMLDPTLLGRRSFQLLCVSGFLTYLGFLVPYTFIQDRNQRAGIRYEHAVLFVTVIGFSNVIGRLIIGIIALKIDPLKLYSICCCVSGISTIFSELSFSIYYQYGYCIVFGFFIASLSSLRSMFIVNLYGLGKLTNATGMMFLFQGLGSLIATPMAAVIKDKFGYAFSFYVSGVFLTLSGFIVIPVRAIATKEIKLDLKNDKLAITKPQLNRK